MESNHTLFCENALVPGFMSLVYSVHHCLSRPPMHASVINLAGADEPGMPKTGIMKRVGI